MSILLWTVVVLYALGGVVNLILALREFKWSFCVLMGFFYLIFWAYWVYLVIRNANNEYLPHHWVTKWLSEQRKDGEF